MKTRYDRTIYEVARIPDGEKVGNSIIPLTVEGYRAVYRGYLARSRPAGCARPLAVRVHLGQSRILVAGLAEHRARRAARQQPGQTVKVAANQAWFEYHPGARHGAERDSLDDFDPPAVKNVAIEKFDDNGLGDEPNNLTAINSLIAYRALRYGRHLDLIITDQHSYRSADPFGDPDARQAWRRASSTACSPRRRCRSSTAGAPINGGNPPAEIALRGRASIANPQKDAPPQTILGAEQKAWFKDQLAPLDGDLEDLGQFAGRARLARRSRKTCRAGLTRSHGRAAASPISAAAITAAPRSSAAKSTTSCATRRSPASRSFRATGTASGPAMPAKALAARGSSSRSD